MPFEIETILKDWGVTFGLVVLAVFAFVVMIALSLREFLYWYLRLNQINQKLGEIQYKIDNLEHRLRAQPTASLGDLRKPSTAPSFPISAKPSLPSDYHLTE